MDDALTIAKRFVVEPSNIRDLELSILRHMEYHIAAERERCAQVADAHKGSAARRRRERGQRLSDMGAAQIEVSAEERGEDIAAEMIAKAIRG